MTTPLRPEPGTRNPEPDETMERASAALVAMDYLEAEALCLDALDAAVAGGAWSYVARIVLPLQEARRQRRMIAADAGVTLGTASGGAIDAWLGGAEPENAVPGCLLVTRPCSAGDARAVEAAIRETRRHGEVLCADAAFDDAAPLPVVSLSEPSLRIEAGAVSASASAVDWFLDTAEALGDAAIASVGAPLGSRERFDSLRRLLDAAPDHEKLHQRLAEAARALAAPR